MHQHFENWNDMKHEPQYFWWAETVFYLCKILFPCTISDGESQTPLLQFFLRGGGSVHRLDSDQSRYFAITEFNNCLIIWSPCIASGSNAICHFHVRRKVWFLLCMSTYYLQSNTKAKRSRTTLRMSRPLFVVSYSQVMWWALGQLVCLSRLGICQKFVIL